MNVPMIAQRANVWADGQLDVADLDLEHFIIINFIGSKLIIMLILGSKVMLILGSIIIKLNLI